MAESRIHRFNFNLIAFFRPVKRTYYIFSWNTELNLWCKYQEEHANITIHKTIAHGQGRCDINVQKGGSTRKYVLTVTADGHFLKIGDLDVPILKKISGHLSPTCIAREYTAEYTHEEYQQDTRLWTISLQQPPPPLPPPPPQALVSLVPVKQIEIPQRIALLVVEDSVKNKEVCPITMEQITRANSAVTSCFHVFNSNSLETWLESKPIQSPCPVCRKQCTMTKV